MANKRPLVLSSAGNLQQMAAGDTVTPALLGTGNGAANNVLRGDGAFAQIRLSSGSVAALDPAKKGSGVTLSQGNTLATFTATQQAVLSLTGITAGKFYFEVKFTSGTGSGNCGIGIVPADEPLAGRQIAYDDGKAASVAIYQGSGTIYSGGAGASAGWAGSFGTLNDVICVAVDATNRLVWFRKGNGPWNGDNTYLPGGTGGIPIAGTGAIFAAIATDKVAGFTANFGGQTFNQSVPAGFSAWNAADQSVIAVLPGDVNVASLASGDLFQYNGTNWVNTPVATAMTNYAPKASPVFSGTVSFPTYTLTTLPSAAANTRCYITVSNATGGPALCISNGTNWINVRTNATVA